MGFFYFKEENMDGTETGQDVTTSDQSKETSALVKAAELKGKSDGLADVKRTLAEAKKYSTAAEAAETRVNKMLKDYEESIRDEPDKLTTYRAQEEKRRVDTELAQKDSELQEANEFKRQVEEEKAKSTMEQNAREIATRLSVEPERLIRLASRTDGTAEAIEDVAKDLPKLEPQEPLNPDSNRSFGGTQSEEKIRKNYMDNPGNPQAKADYLAWRRSKGI